MHISHIALWTKDLERAKDFWVNNFGAKVNVLYVSKRRESFKSYFIALDSGPKIELMTIKDLVETKTGREFLVGWNHLAISLGSKELVDEFASKFEKQGLLISPPRLTGDHYYEAVVMDYDGNHVEITS